MEKRNKVYTTLEEIREEKLRVQTKIYDQKASIANTWNEIFEPSKASTKAEQVFNLVDNSIAIYDGAMLGYKIIHRLRSFFRRKKDH